jgi:pyrroloquinoline-quinone synthase
MRALVADLKRPAEAHPYFAALRSGAFRRDDFVATQAQFLFAVDFFPRPMRALLERGPLAREALLDNLADEAGRGDATQAHGATFRTLLARLGADEPAVTWPEVRAFNATLLAVCEHEPPAMGLAMLGVVEDLFATFSGWIGRAIVAHGWLGVDELVHYGTHERLDPTHAEGFYAPIETLYPAAEVRAGLELGACVFLRLYHDLYEARERR